MAQVTSFIATVPVGGDAYGDISRSITTVGENLTKQGWIVYARAIETGRRFGSPVYGKAEFTLRKKGREPFEDTAATNAVNSAASSIGLKLGLLKDWVVQTVTFVKEAGPTAVKGTTDLASRKKAEYDACIAAGGSAITCAGGSVGLPSWVFPAALGLGALLVLGQVASIKRSFSGLGGLGCGASYTRRRRR